jgi:hypothetical protein
MFVSARIDERALESIYKIIDKTIKNKEIFIYGDDYNKIFTKEKKTWKIIKKELIINKK